MNISLYKLKKDNKKDISVGSKVKSNSNDIINTNLKLLLLENNQNNKYEPNCTKCINFSNLGTYCNKYNEISYDVELFAFGCKGYKEN